MTIKLTLATILGALALMLVGTSSFSLLQAWQAHSLASYIEAVSTADGLILEATNAARSERGGMRRALRGAATRSEETTSELQSLMRTSYAGFCLKNKTTKTSSTSADAALTQTHTNITQLRNSHCTTSSTQK